MNINKLKKLQLSKLIELKSITSDFCDKYSKMLTDYSVIQTTSQQLMEMTPSQKENFEKRRKFSELLGAIDNIIEEKLFNIYDEKD